MSRQFCLSYGEPSANKELMKFFYDVKFINFTYQTVVLSLYDDFVHFQFVEYFEHLYFHSLSFFVRKLEFQADRQKTKRL